MPTTILTDGTEIECINFEETSGGLYLRDDNHDLIAFVPYNQLHFVRGDDVEIAEAA
jgi:hypothetical protein